MAEFTKAFKLDDESKEISKEDALKLMTKVLMSSKADLEAMARNADLPIAIACQIKAIVTDMQNGRTDTVDRLFDRLYGKSIQPMELTGAEGTPLIPKEPMSRKEYAAMLNKLKGIKDTPK